MKAGNVPPPGAAEAEVAALITTLHETEQRLEELTGGQVDTVSDRFGRPYLLRRAQAELRDREAEKQAAILNALPAHIALLDAMGVIISVNETWRRFATANFLPGSDHGIGLNYLDVCDHVSGPEESDAHRTAEGIRAVLAGEKSFSIEYPCHSPTEQRWFLMTVTPLSRGKAHGAVVMHLNITQRRQAEEALRDNQATLAAAQQIGHIGSWEVDLKEGNIETSDNLRWSDEMFRIAGYEPGAVEITRRFFLSRVPPEEHGAIRQIAAAAIRERKPVTLVHHLIRADGATCVVQEVARAYFDERTGQPARIIGTAHDISEQTRLEQATAEALRRLTEAQRIAQVGDWEWDLATQAITWSPQVFAIHGRDPCLGPPRSYEEQNALFDAPSRARLQKNITEAIESGETRNYELVALRPDGARINVQAMAVPRKDESGKVVGVYGTIQDITARKRSEAALKESESRYHSLFENMLEGYAFCETRFEHDQLRDFIYLEVNSAFEKITGLKNVIGKKVSELIPGIREADSELFEIYGRVALTGKSEKCEVHLKVFGLWLSVAVYSSDRDHFVVVFDDITERKLAEQAMRESNEKFHQLANNISDAFWIRSPDMSEVQYVSPAFEKIWGRSVASLKASPHQWSEFILAEDRPRVLAAFAGLTGSAVSLDIEYRIVRPDGEVRWVRVRGSQIRNEADHLIRHIGIVTDITEQRHMTDALRTSEAEFRALAESMPQIVWITRPDGWNIYFNQQWTDYTGLTLKESTGHGWNIPFHPDDQERAADAWRQATATGGTYSLEVRLRRADGVYRWWLVRGMPVRDATGAIVKWFGTCTDIHDLKQAEVEVALKNRVLRQQQTVLQESERRFKALFDQAAVGVALTDAMTGRFVQVNQRFADILGRSREELEQLTSAAITPPRDMAFDLEKMQQLKAGSIHEYAREKRYLRKDGSDVWVSLTVSAMWAPGETPGLCIEVGQDITERKRLDEHLLQAQKMEALGQFSGGVAHDFNNILSAVSGYTELARMSLPEDSAVRGFLDHVLVASGRAADLVKQILAFSRQETAERTTIDLLPVVAESLKLLRATIPSTIEFETLVATDAPTVLANAGQVHQIIVNLAINAWHAMKDHPGRLRVKLEKCVVDEAKAARTPRLRPGVYALLSVSDTGKGMDAATLRRIFEPFFTTKPVGEGTGLGLAVVYGLMESHDGAVTVHSQPGEGTVFRLYFPAHTGEMAAITAEEKPTPRGHGERVLVVDDEEVLAWMCQKTLETLGYEAEFATAPAAALAMVRAAPGRFALVITDQTMPGMTGLVLAGQLRLIQPELPIILTTGYGQSLTPDRLAQAGIGQFLLKPVTIQSLGMAVHAALTAQPAS